MYSKQTEVYDTCACALAHLFAPSKRASTTRGKCLGRRGYIPACIISPGRNRNCRAVWIEWAPQRPLKNIMQFFIKLLLAWKLLKLLWILHSIQTFLIYFPTSKGRKDGERKVITRYRTKKDKSTPVPLVLKYSKLRSDIDIYITFLLHALRYWSEILHMTLF